MEGISPEANDREAIMWYRKAAEQGEAQAMTELGKLHAEGRGVPQSFLHAKGHFERAAGLGNREARAYLSRIGDLKDIIESGTSGDAIRYGILFLLLGILLYPNGILEALIRRTTALWNGKQALPKQEPEAFEFDWDLGWNELTEEEDQQQRAEQKRKKDKRRKQEERRKRERRNSREAEALEAQRLLEEETSQRLRASIEEEVRRESLEQEARRHREEQRRRMEEGAEQRREADPASTAAEEAVRVSSAEATANGVLRGPWGDSPSSPFASPPSLGAGCSPSPSPGEEDIGECKICFENPVDCVLLECGHLCCCRRCGGEMITCPMCRQPITRVLPVFKT